MQAGILLLFGAVMAKVAYTQTVDPDGYTAQGVRQRLDVDVIPAARGSILDRSGIELALSIPQQTVWADPQAVIDPLATAQRLATVLDARPGVTPTDVAALATHLADPASRFTYVSRQVDDTVAAQIAALELPGVYLREEPRRFQPSGVVAQSIVGSTDLDGRGTAGVEMLYDEVLTGTDGELVRERSPNDRTLPGEHKETAPVPGTDVVLTLDRTMQYEAEQILLGAVEQARAKGGMVVVMDPHNGDILAMANVERHDGTASLSKANKAMVEVFEPGSVNKMITMAAAIEQGVTRPGTTWEIPPYVEMDDTVFRDTHPDPDGLMTATEIMVESSNLGTYELARRLGEQRLYEYFAAFGLTDRTPINFPDESAGLVPPPERWYGRAKVTIPYGQGVAVTAVQMLGAYNVIANGGTYVPPRLVAAVVDPDGTRHDAPVPEGHRVVSSQTAAEVTSMLTDVVNADRGTGTAAQIPGYSVAGKTGTAKKPQGPDGYLDENGKAHYMQVFAGMVPAENPRFTALVVLDESRHAEGDLDPIFGGVVAAPVFAELGTMVLRRLQVPPTQPVDAAPAPAPDAAIDEAITAATIPVTNIQAAVAPAPTGSP